MFLFSVVWLLGGAAARCQIPCRKVQYRADLCGFGVLRGLDDEVRWGRDSFQLGRVQPGDADPERRPGGRRGPPGGARHESRDGARQVAAGRHGHVARNGDTARLEKCATSAAPHHMTLESSACFLYCCVSLFLTHSLAFGALLRGLSVLRFQTADRAGRKRRRTRFTAGKEESSGTVSANT